MPTLLAESLRDLDVDLKKIFNSYCREDDLQGLDLLNPNPQALLYQTGYLTIKGYNPKIKKVRLGIPNREVKDGLYHFLLPYYMKVKSETIKKTLDEISDGFILGNPEEAMKAMQTYFAGVDYKSERGGEMLN